MFLSVIYFILAIVVPYVFEQIAYRKFIPAPSPGEKKVVQEYGWRIVWDLAYYFVLFGSGYTIIVLGYWVWWGYVIFLSGILLRAWALSHLRRFYDPALALRSDHQLVQSGPFRVLRHPLHLGTTLKITGLAAFLPLWLALPTVVASVAVGVSLGYLEDRVHLDKFGSDFRAYYLRTWDIVDLIFWKKK